ncbi:unnamed protein product [Polarella glacialis]|uniref:Ketosynthase family 3 (KS3) domain-containing protein n=1 Tax=Polarella glacialis TaxID=89957 RepID=A0A813EVD7_POLGL|nr:unnamed protein product [Polarella glacialis]
MGIEGPSETPAAQSGPDPKSVLAWAGLSEEAWTAIFTWLCGDVQPSLRLFGLLAADVVRRALEEAKVPVEPVREGPGYYRRLLSEKERSAAARVWRAARQLQGHDDRELWPAEHRVSGAPPEQLGVLPNAFDVASSGHSRFLVPPTLTTGASTVTDLRKVAPVLPRSAARLLASTSSASSAAGVLVAKGISYSHGINSLRLIFSSGADCAATIPKSRWDHDLYFDFDAAAAPTSKAIYTKHAAIVDLPGAVDHAFFGISADEAARMDPMQRSCLKQGFRAVVDAKITRASLRNSHTGVYVGTMNYDYVMDVTGLHRDRGNMSLLANRLSHSLALRGPSIMLDTGCSASLVSADMAANHIRRHRVPLGLALGVNHLLHPLMFAIRCAGNLLSKIGRSQAFHARADGYLVGEGCGAVVLGWASSASRTRPCWKASQAGMNKT